MPNIIRLSKPNLEMLLREQGLLKTAWGYLITDQDYALPTRRWLETAFFPWWNKTITTLVKGYKKQAFDCEDYVRLIAGFASVAFTNTLHKPTDTALALGEIMIKETSADAGHALCLAITRGPKPLFIEPQPPAHCVQPQDFQCLWLRL